MFNSEAVLASLKIVCFPCTDLAQINKARDRPLDVTFHMQEAHVLEAITTKMFFFPLHLVLLIFGLSSLFFRKAAHDTASLWL